MHEKYGDLATWEMKSLSVGDARVMLGVVAMAAGAAEKFEWQTCNNPLHPKGKKKHSAPKTIQLLDNPETMLRLGLDDPRLMTHTPQLLDLNETLDDSLRRGGSSLIRAFKFDKRLMAVAKGDLDLEASQDDADPLSEEEAEDTVSAPGLDSLQCGIFRNFAEGSSHPADPKAKGKPRNFFKSLIRSFSQDDQDTSADAAGPMQKKSRSATWSSLGSSLARVPKLKSGLPANLLKRKKTRSILSKKST